MPRALRGFFDCHSDEVTKLHQSGLDLVLGGKLVESVVEREESLVLGGRRDLDDLDVHSLLSAAVAQRALDAGGEIFG
jgi:hypothetical protein